MIAAEVCERLRAPPSSAGEVSLSVVDGIRAACPEMNYGEAYRQWLRFANDGRLPPQARARERDVRCPRRIITPLATVARLIMSLPGDAERLRGCVESLVAHFDGDPKLIDGPHRPLDPNGDLIVTHHPALHRPAEEADGGPEVSGDSGAGRLVANGEFSVRYIVDRSGELWFPGYELAKKLGYIRPNKALVEHIEPRLREFLSALEGRVDAHLGSTAKKDHDAVWVKEAGVYQLIFHSRAPLAEKFKAWLSEEVLPQLRRTGSYSLSGGHKLQPKGAEEGGVQERELLVRQMMEADVERAKMDTAQGEVMLAIMRARLERERVEGRRAELDLALRAREVACELGLDIGEAQLNREREAVEAAAQPAWVESAGSITAAEYLRVRGLSEQQMGRLQGVFGKLTKTAYDRFWGSNPQRVWRDTNVGELHLYSYDRRADRVLLDRAFSALTATELWHKVMPPPPPLGNVEP